MQLYFSLLRSSRSIKQNVQNVEITLYRYSGSLNENNFDVPTNVKFLSWLPQNDLLAHEKTKLFITHGGANGDSQLFLFIYIDCLLLKKCFWRTYTHPILRSLIPLLCKSGDISGFQGQSGLPYCFVAANIIYVL